VRLSITGFLDKQQPEDYSMALGRVIPESYYVLLWEKRCEFFDGAEYFILKIKGEHYGINNHKFFYQ